MNLPFSLLVDLGENVHRVGWLVLLPSVGEQEVWVYVDLFNLA